MTITEKNIAGGRGKEKHRRLGKSCDPSFFLFLAPNVHHMPEGKWHIFVEVQQFVHSETEMFCNVTVYFQENAVLPQCKCSSDTVGASGLSGVGTGEAK